MVWRLPRKQWEQNKGEGNRKALRKVVQEGRPPGVLAYVDDQPIGWCAIAPRSVYVTLERSRVLRPIDDKPVWSVSCLFIARDHRRKGLSSKLLRAAVKFAKSQGATVVEGYPVQPYSEKMPAAFAWTGLLACFERAGFKEAARHSKSRPIVRKRA